MDLPNISIDRLSPMALQHCEYMGEFVVDVLFRDVLSLETIHEIGLLTDTSINEGTGIVLSLN